MKTLLTFSLFIGCLTALAQSPAGLCERTWQSPAQRAQGIFTHYQSQVKAHRITVDIDPGHLKKIKKPPEHRLSRFPSFQLMLYKGKRMVLKPLSLVAKNPEKASLTESYRELAVYRTLQALNVPTLFYGVTRLKTKALPAEPPALSNFQEQLVRNSNNGAHVSLDWQAKGSHFDSPHFSHPLMALSRHFSPPKRKNKPLLLEPEFFMVLKFQEGEVLHLDKVTNANWALSRTGHMTDQTAQDLKTIRDLFVKYAILPRDFQIVLSPEGQVHTFDVEYYEFLGDKAISPQNEYAHLVDSVFNTEEEKHHLINLYFDKLVALPNHIQDLMAE